MSDPPVYPGIEPEQENLPEFQEVKPQRRKLGTGEPIFLYVEVSRGVFDNVGEFPSRVEASHYAEENWRGHRFKTFTAQEAVAEQERYLARQERVRKTVEKVEKGVNKLGAGLKRVGKNLGRNAEAEARAHGMIHTPPAQPSQNINVNVNTQPQQREVEDLRKFGQHINRSFNPLAEDFNPPPSPKKKPFVIQQPRSRTFFQPPRSPIQPSKHSFNPPKHSTKQYGVRQQHGAFAFSDNIRPYRIPITHVVPQRPSPSQKVIKKKKRRKR